MYYLSHVVSLTESVFQDLWSDTAFKTSGSHNQCVWDRGKSHVLDWDQPVVPNRQPPGYRYVSYPSCLLTLLYGSLLTPTSCLFTGMGNSFFSIVLAEVGHGSSAKDRTAAVSAIMASRQLGLLLGAIHGNLLESNILFSIITIISELLT